MNPLTIPRTTRYDHLSIRGRTDYSWPEGRRLAFWVTTNIEASALMTGCGPDPGGADAPQTQRNCSWCDYCLRVGIWRLFDLADELGIPLSHNMNSLVCTYAPDVPEAIRAYCKGHPQAARVWWTNPGAIAAHCIGLPAGVVPGGAA
ncbi:MAG: hypothetical protein ACK515_01330 [bacterium]|jgi:hypothetical protein|nr:hypothetical protein [Betaproteobacteria bacterium]